MSRPVRHCTDAATSLVLCVRDSRGSRAYGGAGFSVDAYVLTRAVEAKCLEAAHAMADHGSFQMYVCGRCSPSRSKVNSSEAG